MHSRSFYIGVACSVLLFAGAGCRDVAFWGAWHQHGGGKPDKPPRGGSAGSGSAGSGGAAPSDGPSLPEAKAACPKIETGTTEFLGIPVRLWVGERRDDVRAPLVFYWHGTGSSPSETQGMFSAGLREVLEQGGVVAALGGSTGEGDITSTGTWTTGDFEIADEVVACAIEQRNIDPRRIYTTGCSSGGVHASVMAFQRSSYIAAATPNSGGIISDFELEDPTHTPAVMAAHGALGTDVVIVEFAETTARFTSDIAELGGFAVKCDHGGGHCQAPEDLQLAQWQFLKDHPYGVSPEPYAAGLPAPVPDYCEVIEP